MRTPLSSLCKIWRRGLLLPFSPKQGENAVPNQGEDVRPSILRHAHCEDFGSLYPSCKAISIVRYHKMFENV
ncbi:hypothetical protein QYM36_005040 [Artemia franciscana]|uniref:Uncharacterized protein n=1 Tax=Artemia franciscana TaxID=6661 RepID=A0AA88LAS9_ARTSF|nr:hypothetical protein QYM36_005040 [Artemia franciscana]